MKIAVLGAGALGCLFGAGFSSKHEVILITHHKDSADAINLQGIMIKDDTQEKRYVQNLGAYESGSFHECVDFVVILVKTTQTKEALEQNKDLIGPDTLVLTLQNGLGNYEQILPFVKNNLLLVGTTNHNSVLLGKGKIYHSGSGVTAIGGNGVSNEYIQKVHDLFQTSGFDCVVSDNIGYLIWKKLFVNLAINSFTYITQTPMGFICHNSYAQDFVKKIITEAVVVAQAEGYKFDNEEVIKTIQNICREHMNGFSSMSQDRKKKAKTEIDSINGAIVNVAKNII